MSGILQALVAAGSPTVTLAFTASAVDTTNASSYTFTAQAIGTANAGRKVVCGVSGPRATAGNRTVSSMTIGGVSASMIVQKNSAGGNDTEIWQAVVPTGTTADVVVNWSAQMTSCQIGLWTLLGAASAASATANAAATTPTTTFGPTINISAGGVGIAMLTDQNSNTFTWSGLTLDFNRSGDNTDVGSGASKQFAVAQVALSVQATPSPNVLGDAAMVVAAWAVA